MASSGLMFQSRYDYQRQHLVERQVVNVPSPTEPSTPSKESRQLEFRVQEGQRILQQHEVTFSAKTQSSEAEGEPVLTQVAQRFQKMITLLEKMFDVKVSVYDAQDFTDQTEPMAAMPSSAEATAPVSNRQGAMAMREYHQVSETESSAIVIQGQLALNDGRHLNVDFSLDMSRSRYEEYYGEIVISGRQVDPLVINLNGNAAQLTNKRLEFDLDADGQKEHVAFATEHSAFLALDKNKNGTIDDGNELFGPRSGSGFADLSAYDDNDDGFVDPLDSIWSSLVLVQRDESGAEHLLSLKDVGISAFVLERVQSPFSLFDQNGQQTGIIRETGLYVRDDGSVDSMQHVDLLV